MPGPVIVIEAPEAQKSPILGQALVDACQVGLVLTRCVVASPASPVATPTAIATVAWRGPDRLNAVVEVGRRADTRPEWVTRELQFRAEDDPAERWKAVGFTIATLASEVAPAEIQEKPEEPDAPPTPPPSATSSTPQALTPPPTPGSPARKDQGSADRLPRRDARRLAFVTAVVAGPGFNVGPWRVGGALGVAYRVGALPLWLQAGGSYAVRPEDDVGVSATWLSASAGPAIEVPLAFDCAGRLSLEVLADNVTVHAVTPLGQSDRAERFVLGGKATAGVTWPESSPIAGVLVGDVSRLSGGTTIQFRGEPIASSPAANYSFRIGLEWRPL